MKKIFLLVALILPLCYSSCKEGEPDEPELGTVVIGTQIWTTANYKEGDKELFTYNEAKAALLPPNGFRLPTKADWGKLLTFLGHKNGYLDHVVFNNNSITITESGAEGDFETIKALLAGVNTTGFNLQPLSSNVILNYYMSDPNYGYVEFSSAGYFAESYSRDPRQYFPAGSFPDKYLIRFVKDK